MRQTAVVIGDPVAHSLSPVIHNAAFAATGIDAVFEARRVPAEDLGAAVADLRAEQVLGVSVTMPHKATVLEHLDEVRPEAKALEAVNCIVPDGGRLVGANTDGQGFVAALLAAHVDLVGTRVLVVGAGGAARAVVRALAHEDVATIGIANRTPDRAKAAVLLGGRDARVADLADVPDYDVVVNATSVGMGVAPEARQLPIDPGLLTAGQVVVDLVYEPVETGLLAAARAAGARPVDGVGMLVHQAADAFTLWTGEPAPVDAMHAAARAALVVPKT